LKQGIFEHPPYTPDLAPSDCHLFLHPKKFLAGQNLRSNQQTKDIVQDWRKGWEMTLFDEGIQKPVLWYDKCLNLHGDYVEK
jgi:hypothetical protein